MAVPARLDKFVKTEKQRHFPKDFMTGWEDYETWAEATVGQSIETETPSSMLPA